MLLPRLALIALKAAVKCKANRGDVLLAQDSYQLCGQAALDRF